MRLTSMQDLLGGLLLTLVGVGAVLEAHTLTIGSLTHMGSGYVPLVFGYVLAGIGVVMAAGAFLIRAAPAEGTAFVPTDWRGCAAIVAGLLSFLGVGWYFGLAPATFCCVLIAAFGDRTTTVRGALILAAAMTVFTVGLFAYILQIQIPVLQW